MRTRASAGMTTIAPSSSCDGDAILQIRRARPGRSCWDRRPGPTANVADRVVRPPRVNVSADRTVTVRGVLGQADPDRRLDRRLRRDGDEQEEKAQESRAHCAHRVPGDFVPRTPLHARSRGPQRPAPLAWLTRSARSRYTGDFVPRTPLHARSRGPQRPAPLAWLTRFRSFALDRGTLSPGPLTRSLAGTPRPAPLAWLTRFRSFAPVCGSSQ